MPLFWDQNDLGNDRACKQRDFGTGLHLPSLNLMLPWGSFYSESMQQQKQKQMWKDTEKKTHGASSADILCTKPLLHFRSTSLSHFLSRTSTALSGSCAGQTQCVLVQESRIHHRSFSICSRIWLSRNRKSIYKKTNN